MKWSPVRNWYVSVNLTRGPYSFVLNPHIKIYWERYKNNWAWPSKRNPTAQKYLHESWFLLDFEFRRYGLWTQLETADAAWPDTFVRNGIWALTNLFTAGRRWSRMKYSIWNIGIEIVLIRMREVVPGFLRKMTKR